MIKHIPNLLTCANLLCGIVGITIAIQGELQTAAALIWVAGVFDFFDGFTARMLNVKSEIGKQLDSMADLVTFGVFPSVLTWIMISDYTSNIYFTSASYSIALCAAIRLAKFNIDDRQTDGFIGLPTPASALFISALPFVIASDIFAHYESLVPVLLSVTAVVLSIFNISNLRLIALKFKSFGWGENKLRYITIAAVAVCVILWRISGIPMAVAVYILLSLFNRKH